MTPLTRMLLLLPVAILLAYTVHAQYVSGIVTFKAPGNQSNPDSGAKIYLCQRVQSMDLDADRIWKKEKVMSEYELSLAESGNRAARHKRVLRQQYGVKDKADIERYVAEAATEEAKIIAAKDVQVRTADSAGFYTFGKVAEGNYMLLIKSRNTNRSSYSNFDIGERDDYVVSRVFGE